MAILGTGTFVYLRPRTISASPLTPNVEPRSLADIVNFTQLNNLHETQLAPLSNPWENAMYVMDSFQGTTPIISAACTKYVCPSNNPATPTHLLQTLQAPTPTTGDQFGASVALGDINGDGIPDLIVGSPGANGGVGAVYIYDGFTGSLIKTINDPIATPGDQFGKVVSFFDAFTQIAVGAPGTFNNGGTVWIFPSTGPQVAQLNGPRSYLLGSSIAIGSKADQWNLLIGEPNATVNGVNSGQTILLHWDGKSAMFGPFLHETAGVAGDLFGASVATGMTSGISSNIIVGAPGDSSTQPRAGAVYIFDPNGNQIRKVTLPSPNSNDNFGFSLAGSFFDVFFEVGAPNSTISGQAQVGAAYTYDTGGNLVRTTNLAGAQAGTFFGYSVARVPGINGTIIGAPGTMSGGSAYEYDSAGRLVRTTVCPVGCPPPKPGFAGGFGSSVAAAVRKLSGRVSWSPVTLEAGRPLPQQSGAVYQYDESPVRNSCAGAASTDCKVVESTGQLFPGTNYAVSVDLVAMSLWSTMDPTTGATAVMTVVCDKNTTNVTIHCSSLYIDGNNWGPDRQTQTKDPFIIVNAEPYWYLRWHWWDPFNLNIVTWYYWWNDSHSHPNWYWGVYWWWRTYVGYYIGTWMPWWWYWWSWQYWQYWDWWSTYFPYSNQVIV